MSNPRLSVVLLIAVQNIHKYLMLSRSQQISLFPRRVCLGRRHQRWCQDNVSNIFQGISLILNIWMCIKVELFDLQRQEEEGGDEQQAECKRAASLWSPPQPWPRGGQSYLMGPVSIQPCLLPKYQLISAMTHSPASPLCGLRNPLNSLKTNPS